MNEVTDYRYTAGIAPSFGSIKATVRRRDRVYFIEMYKTSADGKASTIIKRQTFGSPVYPTVKLGTPTADAILAQFRKFCAERGAPSELP